MSPEGGNAWNSRMNFFDLTKTCLLFMFNGSKALFTILSIALKQIIVSSREIITSDYLFNLNMFCGPS